MLDKWTDEEIQFVFNRRNLFSYKVIAEKLNAKFNTERTANSVRKAIRRAEARGWVIFEEDDREELANDEFDTERRYSSALDSMSQIREEALYNLTNYLDVVGKPKNSKFKVLSISDIHIPFFHKDVLEDALTKHSDADILVLNGDIFEIYSVSRWQKSKEIVLRHEYELAIEWIKSLAKKFPKIILTRGNHEDRIQKYFTSNIDPGVSFLVDSDILSRVSDGYDFDSNGNFIKKYNFPNIVYKKGPTSWFCQIGKTIFAHPSGSSSVPMRTAIRVAEYLNSRNYDFEALICAHTHKMGSIVWNNKLLIEQGCACIPLEYEADSGMKYRPQAFGYAVVYMDNFGSVDFGKTKPIYYGTGYVQPELKISIGE